MNLDSLTNIISALNVPLKILLPSICLLSGFILFADENTMKILHLYEWSTKNGFYFGIAFLVSSIIIVVYLAFFIIQKIKEISSELNFEKNTLKKLITLNNAEKEIVFALYKSKGYTLYVDYSEPVVKSLIARGIIYIGNNAQIHFDSGDSIMVKASVNPAIIHSFIYAKNYLEKEIKKLKRKGKRKNIDKINSKIEEYQEIIDLITEDN